MVLSRFVSLGVRIMLASINLRLVSRAVSRSLSSLLLVSLAASRAVSRNATRLRRVSISALRLVEEVFLTARVLSVAGAGIYGGSANEGQ